MFSNSASVMDLKNNLEARTYMDDKVKWRIWVLRKWPNREEIRAAIGPRCDIKYDQNGAGYLFKNTALDIQTMYSSISTAQNILKSNYNYTNREFVVISTNHVNKL